MKLDLNKKVHKGKLQNSWENNVNSRGQVAKFTIPAQHQIVLGRNLLWIQLQNMHFTKLLNGISHVNLLGHWPELPIWLESYSLYREVLREFHSSPSWIPWLLGKSQLAIWGIECSKLSLLKHQYHTPPWTKLESNVHIWYAV